MTSTWLEQQNVNIAEFQKRHYSLLHIIIIGSGERPMNIQVMKVIKTRVTLETFLINFPLGKLFCAQIFNLLITCRNIFFFRENIKNVLELFTFTD